MARNTAAKLSELDLTDYALNELGPNERLYVESMLAVSEEARGDVYATIDLALMLEHGFERETPDAELSADQRRKLLHLPVPNRVLRNTIATLAAAACLTLAFAKQDLWLPKGSASRMARASQNVSAAMSAVASPGSDDFVTQLANFRKLAEDPALKKWLRSQPASVPPVSNLTPSVSWDPAPRAGLDLLP